MQSPHVTANGTATVHQRPQILLMQVQLVESAPTIAEAISYLKEQMVKGRQLLEEHKPTTVDFGDKQLGWPEPPPEALAARQIAAQRARARKGRHASGKTPKDEQPTVRCYLRAQWPLNFDSDEGVLTFIYRLQRALTTVGGARKPEPELPTKPAWSDPHEELQEMLKSAASFGPEEQDVRIPEYYYVSRMSDLQLSEAHQAAFQQAYERASSLATAAGKQLGELQTVHETVNYENMASNAAAMRRHYATNEWPTLEGGRQEFVWDSLQSARFSVQVTCQFGLI